MCGINGIYAYHYAANPINMVELVATRDNMRKRGPDGAGSWTGKDERIGFGHRRLAIIDLSEAGHQPMESADGRFVVTFNGEIYNFGSIRRELETRGYVFSSHSDTEVLLHLFADKGAAMVHDLRGMFAFAIWDRERQSLFLARDPYGIKPLYYADDGWTFRFASQVKALLAGGAVSRDPDPAGVVGFFLLGSVPEPFTTYAAIRSVPAGATLTVDCTGAGEPQTYHAIGAVYANRNDVPAAVSASAAQAALFQSVRAHLVADVAIGAFLSAGVDSGALVGLMRDAAASEIKTVTIAFEEFRGRREDESLDARRISELYETEHTTRIVTRQEFTDDLPRIFDAMDQPSIDGINTWFVAKAARELGLKVAISGLGGDELLGGYPSFRSLPKWVYWLRGISLFPGAGTLARRVCQPFTSTFDLNPKVAGLLELGGTFPGAYLLQRGLHLPWELASVVDSATLKYGYDRLDALGLFANELRSCPASPFAKVATLESAFYMRNQLLRDTDWASMAHSLEVRVPLVDSILLSAVAPMCGRFGGLSGKQVLAQAPSRPLPDTIVNRAKTGFTTPIDTWQKSLSGEAPAAPGTRMPWAREWSVKVGAQSAAVQ